MDTRSRSVDVLSDMLKAVRLTGAIFLKGNFGAPWAIASSGQQSLSRLIRPSAKHFTMFHMVMDGRCQIELPGCDPLDLGAGDLMLLPFGDRHILRNGDAPIVEADALVPELVAEGVMTMQVGHGPDRTHIVCGFVQSGDLPHSPVFSTLPRLIVERTAEEPVTSLLANTVRHLMNEVEGIRPGSRDMLGRMMEMLFIEMLRRHVARMPPESTGWLAALNDPLVGRALQAIHAKPMTDWTVEGLAMHAGASRSVLAERFKETLGQPPMQYLAAWRLQLAMNMLRDGRPIAEIAVEIGYESEAAFSRAFKRHLGLPPGAWRDQAVIAQI